MAVTIRRARPAEAAELAELAALTFPLACPPHTTEAAKQAFIAHHLSDTAFAGYLADASRTLLVADDAGALLGYAMLVAADPADADVAAVVTARPAIELSKFYVHPAAHGAGVAAALMSEVLRVARASGAASLWLGVNEENARAQRFYAKNGFGTVGRKGFLVGDRVEHDFVLELPLN